MKHLKSPIIYEKVLAGFNAEKYFPLFLLILTYISYGLLLPSLGYYGDDWNIAWLAYKAGSVDIFLHQNRTIIAPLFNFLTKLLTYDPWQWHLLLLILRWLIALVLFYFLKSIKILDKRAAYWISVLFLIYPGALIFYQSVTFSVGFFQLLLFVGSFSLHSLSLKNRKGSLALKAASLVMAFANLLISEYFYFLELLRPILVWFVYGDLDRRVHIKKVLINCLPYLLIFIILTLYRFLFPSGISGAHAPVFIGNLTANPINAIKGFISTAVIDSLRLGVLNWLKVFQPQHFFVQQGRITTLIYLILVVISFLAIVFYFSLIHRKIKQSNKFSQKNGLALIGIGWMALLLAGLPFWIADLKIIIGFNLENRFALPFSFGAAFIVAGLLLLIPNRTKLNLLLLSLICAFSIGMHFFHANLFRYDWINQKRIYWQLAWRFPTLAGPATLITDIPPFDFEGENPLSIGINWIYFHDNQKISQNQAGYYLYYDQGRIDDEMNGLNEPLPSMHGHLFGRYAYNQYHLLTFSYKDGCLKTLDPSLVLYDSSLPDYLVKGALISDLNKKYLEDLMHPAIMDPRLFGTEPEHNWCYYFEKADLARSQGQWPSVLEIENEASRKGFSPILPIEKLPFLEAYLGLGNWEAALDLSRNVSSSNPSYDQMLCSIWKKFNDQSDSYQSALNVLEKEMGCNF